VYGASEAALRDVRDVKDDIRALAQLHDGDTMDVEMAISELACIQVIKPSNLHYVLLTERAFLHLLSSFCLGHYYMNCL